MEAGSLVLSPNGTGENIAVKEMMPYGGTQSHSLVETDDGIGIGIVQFLRGKSFFITGATGFLAKGKHKYWYMNTKKMEKMKISSTVQRFIWVF